MKFINKKNIKEYVSPENMQRCWGGQDDYVFKFEPQNPKVQILPRDADDMGDGNNNESQQANRNPSSGQNGTRKVRSS